MRKRSISMAIIAMATIALVAYADSAHYKKGPFLTDNGLTATATGSVAGLGNGNVMITLDFPNATGTTTCTNPGGNQAAGQNPATPADVSGTALFTNPKNGTLAFSLTTATPANPTPQAAGCPNGSWTAAFSDISFGSGTLTIAQDNGTGTFVTVLTTSVSLP
jgi:hypothetical protein